MQQDMRFLQQDMRFRILEVILEVNSNFQEVMRGYPILSTMLNPEKSKASLVNL